MLVASDVKLQTKHALMCLSVYLIRKKHEHLNHPLTPTELTITSMLPLVHDGSSDCRFIFHPMTGFRPIMFDSDVGWFVEITRMGPQTGSVLGQCQICRTS